MSNGLAKIAFLGIALVASVLEAQACGIDWLVPVNHFDGVNEFGKLSYWRGIGEIDLGDGLNVQLVLGFNPTRKNSSACGPGWFLGPMDANLVQIDERRFLLTQPDGILREFWRDNPTDRVLHGQGNWQGEITQNTVNLWAPCGWKLTFFNGRIQSITTPKDRILNFVYGNGPNVSEVQEGVKTVLRIDTDTDGNITGLTYENNHISMEMGQRPRVDVIKQLNMVGGMEQSLHHIGVTDGMVETYDFAVDDKVQPTLRISGDTDRMFTWNPSTGQAVRDGNWTYNIVPDINPYENAQIGRSDIAGGNEYWFLDKINGREIMKRANGIQTIRTWFTTGQLTGLLRSTQTSVNGQNLQSERYLYDENGLILREVRPDMVISYTKGTVSSVVKGGKIIWDVEYSPNGTPKNLTCNLINQQ
jgi:hypothetical protein